jgi:hypothetical protein
LRECGLVAAAGEHLVAARRERPDPRGAELAPEPDATTLLLAAVGALAWLRRRRGSAAGCIRTPGNR